LEKKSAMDKNKNRKTDNQPLEKIAGDTTLTTNQGTPIANNQDQLTAGPRGGTLMEDFIFREKMTHFDHERIPERVVHARGSAAHGVFRVYDDSLKEFTKARVLTDPSLETEVFVRFSTVVGFRGSADTVRDVRGFATKFYTPEGNWDLVGNNIPIFFIQDGIKFPDLVHSIKPEPHHEMPQASAAHDNFWDFASLMPEITHMLLWVLSDRALPRSYAMMEGFGVHTFRLVNDAGNSVFCKFHWKPVEGIHSLVWDETQKLAGKDPDFNRRDLWERIENGAYPEYELGLQIFTEEQANGFEFDVLDATKIVPEEVIPVRRVGKMTLNKNPENFFAETEQVAFHVGNVPPGIDFTNDPLFQARMFSYLDTQLGRFHSVNFTELPINQPRGCPVFNNNQDGFMRHTAHHRRVNYEPNSLYHNKPRQDPDKGFNSFPEPQNGVKLRARPESFNDHFSQAELFWNSMSDVEKEHIIEAIKFELGKVEHMYIRERVLKLFYNVAPEISERAGPEVGVMKVDGDLSYLQEHTTAPLPGPKRNPGVRVSPALSQLDSPGYAKGRTVAILAADGVNGNDVKVIKESLMKADVMCKVVAPMSGKINTADGVEVEADENFRTTGSIMFDAVYVPGGNQGVQTLLEKGAATHFVNEAFKHCKPVAAYGDGVELLRQSQIKGIQFASSSDGLTQEKGVLTMGQGSLADLAPVLAEALAKHRFWDRETKDMVPA
jgi:catalase